MPHPNLNTPDAVGPIRNPDARRVCTLSGIATAQEKIVTLRQLSNGLDISIRELDSQRRAENIAEKALLVARFTKATCDAFLSMGAALSKAFLPQPASKQI